MAAEGEVLVAAEVEVWVVAEVIREKSYFFYFFILKNYLH